MTRLPKQPRSKRTTDLKSRKNTVLCESYKRGRHYLSVRRAGLDVIRGEGMPYGTLLCFRKGSEGQRIVSALATKLGTTESTLKEDAKFAVAIEIIVEHCGKRAIQVLLDGREPQTNKAILKLSRKSQERQQFRIDLVASGQAKSVGPQSTDRVPDTMTFAKILNRFARAMGSLSASHWLLTRRKAGLRPELLEDLLKTARACEMEVLEFARLHLARPVNHLSAKKARPSKPASASKLEFQWIGPQMKSALALIAKNVRDLPTSSYDLRPSRAQFNVAKGECGNLRRICRKIKAELKRLSPTKSMFDK